LSPTTGNPDGSGLDCSGASVEERFRALFDGFPLMIFAVDARGRVCGVNRQGAAELGYAPEQLGGADVTEVFHPDDRDVVREHLSRCLADSAARHSWELRKVRRNGETLWVREVATALPRPAGEPVVLIACENITERKRDEEELRRLRDRLEEEVSQRVVELERVTGNLLRLQRQQQALLDGIPDIAWIKDSDSRYLAANRSLATAFGLEPAALVGKNDFDLSPRELAERYRADDRDVIRRGTMKRVEEPWVGGDGVEHWIETTKVPVLDGHGKVIGTAGIARDITERKRAEEELRRSNQELEALIRERTCDLEAVAEKLRLEIGVRQRAEEELRQSESLLRGVFDAMLDGAIIADLDGGVLFGNPAAARLVGLPSAGEGIGRNLLDFVHTDSRAAVLHDLGSVRSNRAGHRTEYRILDPKCEGRWVESVGSTIHFRGKPAIIITLRDITDRKQAQEALRESEEKFRALVENSQDVIGRFDSKCRYLHVNRAIEAAIGMKPEEVIGRTHAELGVADDRAREWDQAVREVFATGRPLEREVELRAADGSRQYSWRLFPELDETGGVKSVVSIARDITEQRRMQQRLLQSQKMEAVGELAGGVAHDFNNVLQALLAEVHLLREHRLEAGLFERTFTELESLLRRAAALPRQLLLFARREVRRLEPLDLNELVRGTERLARRLLRENIRLVVELAEGELIVEADAGQVEQVVMNLAVNASDAMPDGGALTLRTGTNDGLLWLEAEDTGIGMTPEVQRRIFEPFFTTKPLGLGSGLGLSVVHGIAVQHGGRVEVWSAPGTGSRFRVSFPRPARSARARLMGDQAPGLDLPLGNGERVLLIEDEECARLGLGEVVQTLGYSVTLAASGDEALALADAPGFDLLLCDLVLPGTHGTDVAKALRRRWPEMKVVMMSGYAFDEAVRRGVQDTAVRFLQKPFEMAALARELRAALSGN
jgi:PAS domain S-box-containing protein